MHEEKHLKIFIMCKVKFVLHTLFTIIFFFLLQTADAQKKQITSEYAYRHYTTDDGLPSYSLESIYQDSKGFIWVASSGGIAKYDGFTFHRYLEGKFSNITRISENRQNEVIAYGFTLNTVDRKTDTIRSKKFPKGYYVYKNNHGDLPATYFLLNKSYSEKRALFQLTDTGFVKILEHPDFEKTDLFSGRLFVDEKNNKIYVPMSEGISILSLSGERLAFYPGYHAYNFIRYRDTVWFVAPDGIYRFDDDSSEKIPYPSNEYGHSFGPYCMESQGFAYLPCNGKILKTRNNRSQWLNLPVQSYDFVQSLSDGSFAVGGMDGIHIVSADGRILKSFPTDTLRQSYPFHRCRRQTR